MTFVYQAAEDKPNDSSVEWGPGYLGSMSVWGAAQWVKWMAKWPKVKFIDFHIMLQEHKFIFPK
jgi:hypothetical protein